MLLLLHDTVWVLAGLVNFFLPLDQIFSIHAADGAACSWGGMSKASSALLFFIKLIVLLVLAFGVGAQYARYQSCRTLLRRVREEHQAWDEVTAAGGGVEMSVLSGVTMPPEKRWPVLGLEARDMRRPTLILLVLTTELVAFSTSIALFSELRSYDAQPEQCRTADPSIISGLKTNAAFLLLQSALGVPLAVRLRAIAYRWAVRELKQAKWTPAPEDKDI